MLEILMQRLNRQEPEKGRGRVFPVLMDAISHGIDSHMFHNKDGRRRVAVVIAKD